MLISIHSFENLINQYDEIIKIIDNNDQVRINKIRDEILNLNGKDNNFNEEDNGKFFNLLERLEIIKISYDCPIPTKLENLVIVAQKIAKKHGECHRIYLNHLDIIRNYLKENPEQIDQQWMFNVTPLHESACSGLEKLTKLFLEFNPNTTLKNNFNETAAERAFTMGYETLSEMIYSKS